MKKREEGFTIIEVLIVLAIAGLIMLIVFLAVPALQRNQRNNGRNNDGSRISAAITECLANRNGVKTSCDSVGELEVGTLNQLTGTVTFSDNATNPTPAANDTDDVGIWYQRVCNAAGDNATPTGANTRSFAVLYRLEPNTLRCISG